MSIISSEKTNKFSGIIDTFSEKLLSVEKLTNNFYLKEFHGRTANITSPGSGYTVMVDIDRANRTLYIPKNSTLLYIYVAASATMGSADKIQVLMKSSTDSTISEVALTEKLAKATVNTGYITIVKKSFNEERDQLVIKYENTESNTTSILVDLYLYENIDSSGSTLSLK